MVGARHRARVIARGGARVGARMGPGVKPGVWPRVGPEVNPWVKPRVDQIVKLQVNPRMGISFVSEEREMLVQREVPREIFISF